MVTARQKLLDAIPLVDPLKKQMVVAALICGLFRESGSRAVLVGGSAVEFYTAGQYSTADIDFITDGTDRIGPVMESLGFRNIGGTWTLPDDPTIIVEFPLGPLAGASDRVLSVRISDGETADVIGLEDIIVDRVAAATHWPGVSDEFALFMMVARYDEIDWEYCLEAARVVECFDETQRLHDRAHRERAKLNKAP